MNDLPLHIQQGDLVIYADDTTYVTGCETRDEGEEKIQRAAVRMQGWFEANQLALNMEKTKTVHFFTTRRQTLETQSAKFLGVTVDSRLTWLPHIESLARTLSAATYAVRRITQCMGQDAGLLAYHAVFHSRMTYGIEVWGLSSHAGKIFIQQKGAVRAIARAGSTQHCRPLFMQYKILTLPSEVILHSIIRIHRQNFPKRCEGHHHNIRGNDQIAIPYRRLKSTDTTTMAAKIYNKLPSELRTLPLRALKSRVKGILKQQAYYDVEEFLRMPFPFK